MKVIFAPKSPLKAALCIISFLSGSVTTAAVFEYFTKNTWRPSEERDPILGVCFTPGQNCTALIVDAIEGAKQEICVQAYSFTSAPIAEALVRAHENGVRVLVLVDKSQMKEKRSRVRMLKSAGIDVWVDVMPGIAHNKVMIIDQQMVLTGSFNWTNAAEYRNAENVIFIKEPKIVRYYNENWLKRHERAVQNLL